MEVILYLEIQIKTSPYFCIFHNLKVLGTHKNLLSHCKFHENRRQFQKCTSHILLLLDLGENRYKRFEYNFLVLMIFVKTGAGTTVLFLMF